jgi:hypothetical protein
MGRQFFDTYVQALTSRLRGFITKQVKAGRFRETDSYLAARMFIGSIAHYLLVEELFPKLQLRRAKARVVGTFVDIFVKGMIARK